MAVDDGNQVPIASMELVLSMCEHYQQVHRKILALMKEVKECPDTTERESLLMIKICDCYLIKE